MQPKIAIATCFYGKLPWYFSYFLHSCRYNPTVDFFVIGDMEYKSINFPKNVHFINIDIKNLIKIASKKLGFQVSIPYSYKLCDFKPTYGFIFEDLFKGYDFWGHGDIDLVYGNIRNFMTEELLSSFDVVSVRHDYITGTFALYRNNKLFNSLFMESMDYKKVLSNPTHYCFDECNFLWEQLESGHSIYNLPYEIESMTHVVKKLSDRKKIRAHFDFLIVEGTPGGIKWENGKVIYRDKYEAMLYHLIRFKSECKRKIPLVTSPSTIYFNKDAIQLKD